MNFVFSSVTNMERVDFILELSEIEAINGIIYLFHYNMYIYDVCKTITPCSQETLVGQ